MSLGAFTKTQNIYSRATRTMTDPLTGPGLTMESQERPGHDPSIQIEDKFRISRRSTTRDRALERKWEDPASPVRGPVRFSLRGPITMTDDVSFIPIIVAFLERQYDFGQSWKALERRFHEITTNE